MQQTSTMAGPYASWDYLPNEIWLEIFIYLEHADLQALRLTCKYFNKLTSLPEFLRHSKLIIDSNNLNEIHNYINRDDSLIRYQTVEINKQNENSKLLEILNQIGPFIKELILHDTNILKNFNHNLRNLEALHINFEDVQVPYDANASLDLNEYNKLKIIEFNNNDYTLPLQKQSLSKLTKDATNLQIQQLRLRYVSDAGQLIFEVLRTHARTLKHLNIFFSTQPIESAHVQSVVFQQFINIETLMFSGNCSTPWLKVVFESIPNQVKLKNIELSGLYDIDASLIETIVLRWPQTLSQFQLIHSPRASQSALRRFACLRDNLLMLNLTMCNITNNTLLCGIADQPNTVLRQLILNDNTDLNEACICQLAERLPNLITLSLNNCRDAVTDKALAAIFRHQTQLKHLYLDDCIRFGDEALIGFGEEPASISRLTGLQTLSLRQCRNISNRAIMRAFHFRYLRTLRLGYCHKISAQGIEDLVLNCPVIEELALSSCFMIDDEAIYHVAKNLKRLRVLNISNCINLTSRAVDYIIELCSTLRELIMCGIDSLELLATQQRLHDLRPEIKEELF